MTSTIDVGIDLGTTNSLIAKFVKGMVEVYKNPTGNKETLPSVVWLRRDRPPVVGEKAYDRLEKSPGEVIARFKRKMGTTESYRLKAVGRSTTPVELSACVIKELKGFVRSPPGEVIDAAVITVPASFDVVQSNATKEAGIQAGFKQVILLQEPIAASLAYANSRKGEHLEGQWLVYDLGGGTFDLALIRIENGEMKVLDHQGDNYLGGADFDALIVEQLFVPRLAEQFALENLEDLTSASSPHNGLYYKLLHKAEEAKVELSARSSAEIILEFRDDDGEEQETAIQITRSEFENLIRPSVDKTAAMFTQLLADNSLSSSDINFVLMVGGSTFIPYVRNRIGDLLGIPVNYDIDPTNAIAIGAAHFAGTREKRFDRIPVKGESSKLKVRMAYNKASREREELLAVRIDGPPEGLFYRVTREDGGFDTHLKPVSHRIHEDLPLVEDAYNFFNFAVYDNSNNSVSTDAELIGIAQGAYSIAGQPLPEDICLELDDTSKGRTKLALIFPRNSALPQNKKTVTTVTKTIPKGSAQDIIYINVYYGPHEAIPAANKRIGSIRISGTQILRDLIRGSDVELTFDMSESQDLTVKAYMSMLDQEFQDVITMTNREVDVERLNEEAEVLRDHVESEIEDAKSSGENIKVQQLKEIQKEVESLVSTTLHMSADDVTDDKFKLDDRKRALAQRISIVTRGKELSTLKAEFFSERQKTEETVKEHGNDFERKALREILEREDATISSNSPRMIQQQIDSLQSLKWRVLFRVPDFLVEVFHSFADDPHRLNDQEQVKNLITAGRSAIETRDFDRLRSVNFRLYELLPNEEQDKFRGLVGIGE